MTTTPSVTSKPRAGAARVRWWLLCTLVVVAAAVSLSGCGGSSKPSYCSSLSNLKKSVKDLPSSNSLANGVSSLQSTMTNIESNAKTVVNDAKSDFPNETTAISNSVNALAKTVNQISGTPSAATIVTLGQQAAAVVSSVQSFSSATSSKCS